MFRYSNDFGVFLAEKVSLDAKPTRSSYYDTNLVYDFQPESVRSRGTAAAAVI